MEKAEEKKNHGKLLFAFCKLYLAHFDIASHMCSLTSLFYFLLRHKLAGLQTDRPGALPLLYFVL